MRQIPTLITIAAVLLSGCSTLNRQLKAGPAPTTEFLEHREELVEWNDRVPMQRIWMEDRSDFYRRREKFTEIHFLPVTTEYISTASRTEGLLSGGAGTSDIREMSLFVKETFEEAFREDPNRRFQVVDTPGPETIVYEIALTELLPTRVGVNVAGTVLGAFVPGGGLIKTLGKGSIAIETKVRDGNTGHLLVEWKDREEDKFSLVSLADFRPYSFSRQAVRDWAEQLVELYNTPIDYPVRDSLVFTLQLS